MPLLDPEIPLLEPVLDPETPLLDPENPLLDPETPLLDPELLPSMPLLEPENPLLEPENPLLDPATPLLDPELPPSSPPRSGTPISALPPHPPVTDVNASVDRDPHKTSAEARMPEAYRLLATPRTSARTGSPADTGARRPRCPS